MSSRMIRVFSIILILCMMVSPTNIGGVSKAAFADSVDQTSNGTGFDGNANNPSTEDESKAFDNNTGSKWLIFSNNGTIGYDFKGSDAYVITSYAIGSANDAPLRDPKHWKFEGSNDGVNWDTLDEQKNVEFNSRFQLKTFSISNTKSYQMYRLNILANGGENITQLSELQLFGTLSEQKPLVVENQPTAAESIVRDAQTLAKMYEGGAAFDGGLSNPSGNDESKAFDRNNNKKWEIEAANGSLGYDFADENAYIVKGYSIYTAVGDNTRNPKSWTFQGSNDAKTWTTLDIRSNIRFDWPITSRSYQFINESAFKMYRLNITENNGSNITSIGELELIGALSSDLTDGQGGGEASDLSAYNPDGEDESKAFDNIPNTKWLVKSRTGALKYEFNRSSAVVTSYALTSANDAAGRDPKTWRLYGNNGEFEWFLVDQQSNVTFDSRNQTKTFNIKNPKAYSHYMLSIDINNGDSSTQLAELQLFGKLEIIKEGPAQVDTKQPATDALQKQKPLANNLILSTTLGNKLAFSTLISDYSVSLMEVEKDARMKVLASESTGKIYLNDVETTADSETKLSAEALSKPLTVKLVSKDGTKTETYKISFTKMSSQSGDTGIKDIKANLYNTDAYTYSRDADRPLTFMDYLLRGAGRIRNKATFYSLDSKKSPEKLSLNFAEDKASVAMAYNQSRISFTITPENPSSTVTIDGYPVIADQESFKYTIGQGGMLGLKSNTYKKTANPESREVKITITSPDHTKSKTYTVSIKRASEVDLDAKAPDMYTSYSSVDINNLDLAGLKIETDRGLNTIVNSPVVVLDKDTKQIKLNAIAADSTAEVLVNGNSGINVLDFTGDQMEVTVVVKTTYKTDVKDDYAAAVYMGEAFQGKYNDCPREATYKFTFVRGK